MLDKSIDAALLALRKSILRANGAGLDHVEALLVLRSVPMPLVRPAKRPCAARRGAMRRILIEAMRDGSKTLRELVDYVGAQRSDLAPLAVYQRTDRALQKLRVAGRVVHEGWLWGLAP